MKTLKLFVLCFALNLPVLAQVGIGTTDPDAQLDVNGDLRVRDIPVEADASIAKDSLLITNAGYVKKVSTKEVINATLLSLVKGGYSGSTAHISLGANEHRVMFDIEHYDLNNEYDESTGVFTAGQDGIYQIYVQINSASNLGIATDYGIGIYKNNEADPLAADNFSNIGVNLVIGTVEVTPPVRRTQTLIELNAGDEITFKLKTQLTVTTGTISSAVYDSFFTIVQVR